MHVGAAAGDGAPADWYASLLGFAMVRVAIHCLPLLCPFGTHSPMLVSQSWLGVWVGVRGRGRVGARVRLRVGGRVGARVGVRGRARGGAAA